MMIVATKKGMGGNIIMIDFYLYRTKFTFPGQTMLFYDNVTREEILPLILKERPSLEIREGHFWHIGNLRILDENGGYFAVGRTTKSILEKYDPATGNFLEEMLETSPYTHVIFDRKIGVVAIAKKTKLAISVSGIASRILKLLKNSKFIMRNGINVSLDPISDPFDFIESLKAAYSIKSFEVTFSRSNPFDADEYFQKPMERYLDAANGDKGKTFITGADLEEETLVSVTKSVAATGNNAKAVLKSNEKSHYSTKRLRGNPAHFLIPEEEFSQEAVLQDARDAYASVRGKTHELDGH